MAALVVGDFFMTRITGTCELAAHTGRTNRKRVRQGRETRNTRSGSAFGKIGVRLALGATLAPSRRRFSAADSN
jgi:hypothetical protein